MRTIRRKIVASWLGNIHSPPWFHEGPDSYSLKTMRRTAGRAPQQASCLSHSQWLSLQAFPRLSTVLVRLRSVGIPNLTNGPEMAQLLPSSRGAAPASRERVVASPRCVGK